MSNVANHEVISELYLASERSLSKAAGGQLAEDLINEKEKADSEAEELVNVVSSSDRARYKTGSAHSMEIIQAALTPLEGVKVPDMWSKNYIGLYSQYAAVGLLYGSSGTLLPFCVYTYNGAANVCSNARNIVFFAWSFKIVFAVLTDSIRPFGMRRKPWMLLGWSIVLLILLVLTFTAHTLSTSSWLVSLLFMQCFLMLSDVPAGKQALFVIFNA